MITLITGVPGSGKSYLAVKTLSEKFYIQKKNKWYLRDPDLTVFTNINDLLLPSKDLTEIFKTVPFDQFFTKTYQDKIHLKYPKILYVIDECQQYIPPRYNNNDVILYFDTHRHYSDQIFLITQDEKKICKQISTLAEMEYRAVRSTFSLFGEFKYNIKAGGEIYQRSVARKNKDIFALYRSFDGDGQTVKKSQLMIYIILALVVFLIGGFLFFRSLQPSKKPEQAQKISNLNQAITQSTKTDLNQVQHQSVTQPPPDEINLHLIEHFALTERRGLIAFQCPITSDWHFDPYLFPYTIINRGKSFYAAIPESYINQHQPPPPSFIQPEKTQNPSPFPQLFKQKS
jgi:hypothetical protein